MRDAGQGRVLGAEARPRRRGAARQRAAHGDLARAEQGRQQPPAVAHHDRREARRGPHPRRVRQRPAARDRRLGQDGGGLDALRDPPVRCRRGCGRPRAAWASSRARPRCSRARCSRRSWSPAPTARRSSPGWRRPRSTCSPRAHRPASPRARRTRASRRRPTSAVPTPARSRWTARPTGTPSSPWTASSTTTTAIVQAAVRAPGGAFSAPQALAAPQFVSTAFGATAAIDDHGVATVAWSSVAVTAGAPAGFFAARSDAAGTFAAAAAARHGRDRARPSSTPSWRRAAVSPMSPGSPRAGRWSHKPPAER